MMSESGIGDSHLAFSYGAEPLLWFFLNFGQTEVIYYCLKVFSLTSLPLSCSFD